MQYYRVGAIVINKVTALTGSSRFMLFLINQVTVLKRSSIVRAFEGLQSVRGFDTSLVLNSLAFMHFVSVEPKSIPTCFCHSTFIACMREAGYMKRLNVISHV